MDIRFEDVQCSTPILSITHSMHGGALAAGVVSFESGYEVGLDVAAATSIGGVIKRHQDIAECRTNRSYDKHDPRADFVRQRPEDPRQEPHPKREGQEC